MFNGILFQQSLQDLVKGIRAHRRDEDEYVRSKVAEIGDECRSADMNKKTTAILKLTHLQMMGYSMSFASFHVVEVMSSPVFASKRIGYLAAAQSFSPTTDVLLLTTNQFKKDLTNGKLQDCSQALTCLAKLVTEELGRDLEKDVSLLLNSPRPYIRKKALLVLYRLIMVHPDTLPVVSTRFRERLTDSDPAVICAAVTVTCELARAAPRRFLSLAPILYQLLTNRDSNNWMLIKIVKLMGVLTPLEPRLGKKLVDPLTTLMRTTRAKSLLYECCSCITAGLMDHPEAVEMCAQRLVEFMDDTDQNLKYLGLLSMKKMIKVHPHLAVEHRDNILDCLDDDDPGIRMRALELVSEFVTKRTLRDISRILLKKLRRASGEIVSLSNTVNNGMLESNLEQPSITDLESEYRQCLAKELLRAGIYRRSSNPAKAGYELLLTADDFAWYTTSVLGGLADIPLLSSDIRDEIGDQLLELTSRVEALRPVSVQVALSLLSARRNVPPPQASTSLDASAENSLIQDDDDIPDDGVHSNSSKDIVTVDQRVPGARYGDAILSAQLAGSAGWILGEYCELIEDHFQAAKALVSFPRKSLDSSSQVRILTACMKIYASSRDSEAEAVGKALSAFVDSLIDSQFAEVQERAWLFRSLLDDVSHTDRPDLARLFEGKLIPVDHRAQQKISVSGDLDLDQPLLDTGSDSLYGYLLRTIGNGEEDDADTIEDSDSLFKEAVFASSTLSFSSNQVGAVTDLGNSNQSQGTFLTALPAANKEENPFYLGASINAGPSAGRGSENLVSEERAASAKFSYNPGQLSTEAAAVLTEEQPAGLALSDDEREHLVMSAEQGNEELEGALAHAFDNVQPASQQASGAEGPKKKKKKKKKKVTKDGKSKKDKKIGQSNTNEKFTETSLIDFDGTAGTSESVKSPANTPKPKHLADALLI